MHCVHLESWKYIEYILSFEHSFAFNLVKSEYLLQEPCHLHKILNYKFAEYMSEQDSFVLKS